MNTIEGNKLIMEFLTDEPEVFIGDLQKAGTLESLEFHTSWDWLMPVLEKIEKLGVSTSIHYFAGINKHAGGFYTVSLLGYSKELSAFSDTNRHNTKIEAVYKSVISFIEEYNILKSQNKLK